MNKNAQPSCTGRVLRRGLVACYATLVLLASNAYADNSFKDLLNRCGNERSNAAKAANAKCPTNIKDSRYRTCTAEASQAAKNAYNACMSKVSGGSCAAAELDIDRVGVTGLRDRRCALMKCNFSDAAVTAAGFTTNAGGGAQGTYTPPGFTWACPGGAPAPVAVAAAKPAGPDMGTCVANTNFKSSGWNCSQLKGQEAQLNQYQVPSGERICSSSQMDTAVSRNDNAVCANLIEQREAVIKKYRDADNAVDMGKCKAATGVKSDGWQCDAVRGQLAEYEKYKVPAAERLCTSAQVETLIKRANVANCSNVVNQAAALIKKYSDQAEAAAKAAAAAATAAELAKIDMGTCKPDSKFASTGWTCEALVGQKTEFDQLKVPSDKRICTDVQAAALVKAGNNANCANVIAQREAVIRAAKNAAAAAEQAAKNAAAKAALDKLAGGTCKKSTAVADRGWDCSALKGSKGELTALNVPASEHVCTDAEVETVVTAGDHAFCANIINQRSAVIDKYKKAAAAAREKALGTCKPAAGFTNDGFGCPAVKNFLDEAKKQGVPEDKRICSDEQAKLLMEGKNDGHCSNVARQIDAATKAHKAAAAKSAADKAAVDKAAAEKAAAEKVAAEKAAAAKAAADKAAADKAKADAAAALTSGPLAGFRKCADDNQVCKVSGAWTGKWGVGTKFVDIKGTGNFQCLPKGWAKAWHEVKQDTGADDPAPGQAKACYIK